MLIQRLFINRSSNTPLYLQIKEQLKYMIITGQLVPGSKLPSGRQFSKFLHVNRATIINALNELEAEGYLKTEKGIGTYVVEHPSLNRERNHEKFQQIIINAIREAEKLGFTVDEFVTGAVVQAEYNKLSAQQDDFYAVFVECNQPVLDGYKRDVENALNIRVEPILIHQLEKMDRKTAQLVSQAGVVITTFTHLHEVRVLLKNMSVEIIGVNASSYLDLLLRLSKIEEDAYITVVMVNKRGATEVAQSIKDSGVRHKTLTVTSYEDQEDMIEEIKKADYVVASSAISNDIEKYLRGDQKLVTYQNKLDSASINMLRKVVMDLVKSSRSGDVK